MSSPATINKELCAKLSVLIVEDNSEMRRLLSALLAAMGFARILEARDGISALRLIAKENPNIIITDAAMLPMDGYEMTRRIRIGEAGDANRDIPILMLSGHVGRENLDYARDNGVTDYIAKPITAELLYRCVLAAIAKPLHVVESGDYRGPSPRRRMNLIRPENMPDV
jgi:CheY-like chemotaxis protein